MPRGAGHVARSSRWKMHIAAARKRSSLGPPQLGVTAASPFKRGLKRDDSAGAQKGSIRAGKVVQRGGGAAGDLYWNACVARLSRRRADWTLTFPVAPWKRPWARL